MQFSFKRRVYRTGSFSFLNPKSFMYRCSIKVPFKKRDIHRAWLQEHQTACLPKNISPDDLLFYGLGFILCEQSLCRYLLLKCHYCRPGSGEKWQFRIIVFQSCVPLKGIFFFFWSHQKATCGQSLIDSQFCLPETKRQKTPLGSRRKTA